MSYKAYDILRVQPDFNQEPFMGIAEAGRSDVQIGMKAGFSEWTGTTSLAFSFLYRTQTPEESSVLREFLYELKGRWAAFFLPSWQRDFELIAAASIGDTTLTVSEEGFAELTENRPDTEKRVIFALTASGSLQTWNVLSAVDDTGNEVLTLDTPLTGDLDPDTTMMGYCHFVRLADDINDWRYDAPGQGSIGLRFVSVRNKRTVETEELVESAAIADMKAAVNLLATNEDPTLLEFQSPETTGADIYGVSQGTNYAAAWEARFQDPTTIEMENLDTSTITASTLYDGSVASDHLAFCFDSASQEVLAWNHTTVAGQIRLRWYSGGSAQALNFVGISPVAFNTWVIDATVTLGAAETVIFYLKKGYSVIFARLESESFAIENQFLRSPSAPIYLHKAVKNVNVIEIHGMDSGHRKIVWNSDVYRPPEGDEALATMSLAGGTYELIAIATDPEADAQSATIVFSGEYVNSVRSTDPEADGQSATIVFSGGEYVNSVRSTDPEADVQSSALVFSSSGGYTLIAKSTGAETDVQSSTLTFPTGSYEIP